MPEQAVIFDMDGLLLDTERIVLQAFNDTCSELGCTVGFNVFERMIGRNYQASRPILVEALAGQVAIERFEATCRAFVQAQYDQGIPVKVGVEEVLGELARSGVPMAVATSTQTARATEKLEKTGLIENFQVIVGGDQIGRSKPAPDIYLKAAAEIKVAPKACFAFEDSENGVRSAHAAGMTVVQVPDLVAPTADLLTLGHHVAETLLSGARHVGVFK